MDSIHQDTNTSPGFLLRSYREILEAGLHELFEERAQACPMCSSNRLKREQTVSDYVQLKPGHFHMSRCEACNHIFQNPRLNERGLEFYYRDFYTGLGEAAIHRHLSTMQRIYRKRAHMPARFHQPRMWLDVGAGYGHFCRTAREVWKDTELHALDMSQSIERSVELGWAHRAFAGRFVDVAAKLPHTYDVVSMFHYLEHTTDPLQELRAAAKIIEAGGFLMVEVPDPDSIGRRLLGRYWPSWLAPQHLHLIPSRNLQRYMEECGFDVVLWHHAQAHQSTDALFAAENCFRSLVPPPLPWILYERPSSRLRHVFTNLAWFPVKWSMRALDWLLSPLCYLPSWPNTYRVLARKTERGRS